MKTAVSEIKQQYANHVEHGRVLVLGKFGLGYLCQLVNGSYTIAFDKDLTF